MPKPISMTSNVSDHLRPSCWMVRSAFSMSSGLVAALMGLTSYTQMERAMGFSLGFLASAAGFAGGAAAFFAAFSAASSSSPKRSSASSSSAAAALAGAAAPAAAAAPLGSAARLSAPSAARCL